MKINFDYFQMLLMLMNVKNSAEEVDEKGGALV